MLDETTCEVCGEDEWEVLGRRTYSKKEAEGKSPYVQKRFRVLFDKWFPESTTVTLSSKLCRNCGLVIYMPRPEESDIDSKYRYLQALGQDYGHAAEPQSASERRRAAHLLGYLQSNIDLGGVVRVLDYGGGDGRLMGGLAGIGKQCCLVDYNANSIAGVTKLADTIENLDADLEFDLIVCSHVVEHLANPLKTLKSLVSRLSKKGHIFIEVPLEIWKSAPLQLEPVTHINFFTPNSLYNLMIHAGLDVKTCAIVACPYQNGSVGRAIRAIGAKRPGERARGALRSPDAMALMKPGVWQTIRYHMYVPSRIPATALRFLKRLVASR